MSRVAGKTFMFTGTLSVPRHEAQSIVEELGGIAGSSITKETDYLVCGPDQVGKSNKWEKAGLLGITRVDEDYFWDLVKEARAKLPEEEVLLKELENFDSISVEKWKYVFSQNPNLKILTEYGLFCLFHKDDIIEEERQYPPIESMSYYSKENLEKWLGSNGTKLELESRICPYCSYEILYSIDSTYWYCFKCSLFSSAGQELGRHACVNWEKFLDTELGFYENCKVCGSVKFVAYSEVDRIVKFEALRNYVHSLEFAAEVDSIYADIDKRESIVAKLSDEDREKLYAQFVAKVGKVVCPNLVSVKYDRSEA